jgi:hypothetical protein
MPATVTDTTTSAANGVPFDAFVNARTPAIPPTAVKSYWDESV